jgi:hypothetical protein
MAKQLNSVDKVIEHFGGLAEFARLAGVPMRVAWNWRRRGFPPEYYVSLNRRLRENGVVAPRDLWRQRELPPRVHLQAAE